MSEQGGLYVKFNKLFVTSMLISGLWLTTIQDTKAETSVNIRNESIYDLYVDRFFNKTATNDMDANPKDPTAFAGGDFLGIIDKMDYIKEMGFTIVSIGPVFATERYDGQRVLDFNQLEQRFGSPKEFQQLLDAAHKKELKIMVEFPLNNYSENHVWNSDKAKEDWFKVEDGVMQLELSNAEVQNALKEAIVDFTRKYNIDGVKFSQLDGASTSFINDMIDSIKDVRKPIYAIALEESDANFDTNYSDQLLIDFRESFRNTDLPMRSITSTDYNDLLMIDHLETERFTYYSALENMFPPTRIKTALGAIFSMPGVPYMSYGTEIAMNGQNAQESHQIMNFRAEEDIIDYLKDISASLRNKSETLRTGKIELLKNEDGYLVFKRYTDEETFIVVVNNTSGTQRIDLSSDEVAENVELRGLFEQDIVRQSDEGDYRLVLDREIVELYQVTERNGLYVLYIVAMGITVFMFIGFLVIAWKKGNTKGKKV